MNRACAGCKIQPFAPTKRYRLDWVVTDASHLPVDKCSPSFATLRHPLTMELELPRTNLDPFGTIHDAEKRSCTFSKEATRRGRNVDSLVDFFYLENQSSARCLAVQAKDVLRKRIDPKDETRRGSFTFAIRTVSSTMHPKVRVWYRQRRVFSSSMEYYW